MSATDDRFAAPSESAIVRLVPDHPLAWLVSGSGESFCESLPLHPIAAEDGRIERLDGHFARSNRHVQSLLQHPQACILFLGTQGYISLSWMRDRAQAPTWNYASAQFTVDIEFITDPAMLDAEMRDLVGAMEQGRPNAWTMEDMGGRYADLSRGIVGFRAHVRERHIKFELGQDERDDVLPISAARCGARASSNYWIG